MNYDDRSYDRAATRRRLEGLAYLLDSAIPVPGLNFRIGIDGLISLIPVAGDVVGTLLSSYILAEAARLGVPKTTILRMGLNVLIDTLFGMIPVVGDLFDFAWKANQRNVRLLSAYIDHPRRITATSRVIVALVVVAVIAVVILVAILGIWLLAALWNAITT